MKYLYTILFSILLASTGSCQEVRNVKVTVTEEDGTPIKNADTTITFLGYTPRTTEKIQGQTNALGVFQASGNPPLRMSVRIEKKGYYTTRSDRLSKTKNHDVTFVLRNIKEPVPLFAKRFNSQLPDLGKKVGFDFQVGDWVAPDGKGKTVDIFFRADVFHNKEGKDSGKLEVTFPHEQDGIATVNEKNGYITQSEMLIPHLAFKEGYSEKIQRVESGYQNEKKPHNTAYFLRTRAQMVSEDKYHFNYSKFNDGIEFFMSGGVFLDGESRKKHPQEVCVLTFTYYFNPTPNDRNLEFDTNHNLFIDLESTEQVSKP